MVELPPAGPVAPTSTGRPSRAGRSALLLWLGVLGLAAVGVVHDEWWPAEAGAMFSFSNHDASMAYVEGRDDAGQFVAMPASDMGLEPVEFATSLRRPMGDHVGFEDRMVLAEVARLWNDRHPEQTVHQVSLRLTTTDLTTGATHAPILMMWSSP